MEKREAKRKNTRPNARRWEGHGAKWKKMGPNARQLKSTRPDARQEECEVKLKKTRRM